MTTPPKPSNATSNSLFPPPCRRSHSTTLSPGRWRLTLVIAPAGQAPRDPAAVATTLADSRAVAAAPPLELELLPPGP